MPILLSSKPLFRIKFKDADIREVRSGSELEWGLYKITYINKGPDTLGEDNITEYVGGYPDYKKEDFNIHVPEDADSFEAKAVFGESGAFRSHSEGGFDNNRCINNPSEHLNFIPAVTRDFHRDLTLYCKGKQRRYGFNGTYLYDKLKPGTGSFTPLSETGQNKYVSSTPRPATVPVSEAVMNIGVSASNEEDGFVTTYNISGGCTGGASGRSVQVGGETFYGLGNASGGYERGTGDKLDPSEYGNIRPGDILCFDNAPSSAAHDPATYPGHVAFVESVAGDDLLVSEAANSAGVHPNWMCVFVINKQTSLARGYHWWGSSERFIGILRNSVGGGEDEYITQDPVKYRNKYVCGIGDEYGTFSTQSGTQDDPMAPYQIHSPTGNPRYNERGAPFYSYTDERELVYTADGQLEGKPWENIKYPAGEQYFNLDNPPETYNGGKMDW